MDEALVVRRRQAARDLHADVDRLAHGQRAARQALAQRLAVEQFRDGVGQAVVRADVVDREDVRVRERGDGLRFALEAREPIGVAREPLGRTLMATSRLSRVSRAR